MKTVTITKSKILNTGNDSKIIFVRIITGLIFVTEGIQKYLIVSMLGPDYFKEIGFGHPMFWAHFTGAVEISCGILILIGLLTRLASIPLLVVLITALFKVKIPFLITNGFLMFAHEYRIDFALTLLIIMLIIYGGGKWSFDLRLGSREFNLKK